MLKELTERNIKDILIETYEEEAKLQEEEFDDEEFDDFYIFVSTILAYGYSKDEIQEFATKYNIKTSPYDEYPDNDYFYEGLGSLELDKAKIEELKKTIRR